MKRLLLVAVATAAATATTAATTIPTATASAGTTGTPGFVAPGGTIKFETINGGPSVDYYPPAGSTAQPIYRPLAVTSKCGVTNLTSSVTIGTTTYAPVSDILAISITGQSGSPSFYSNDFGTYTASSNCNSNAGKVSLGGTITLSPGSLLPNQAFLSAGLVIGQHNQAGLSWTATNGATTVASGTNALQGPAFSGNSSASNDNTVVSINPTDTTTSPPTAHPFTAVSVRPTGSNSNAIIDLSPGDQPGDTPTSLQLGQPEDYSVDCSSANTVVTSSSSPGAEAQSGTFQRNPNGYNPAKDPTCYTIGVTMQIQPGAAIVNGQVRDVIYWDNTTTSATGIRQQVSATVTVVWHINRYDSSGNLRTAADLNAEMVPYIAYTASDPFVLSQWCGRALAPNTIGYPGWVHPSSTEFPNGVPWCLTSVTSQSQGDYITLTQVYDGVGDPRTVA